MCALEKTYCDCCDTGEKGFCCCGLKRAEKQLKSFVKLPDCQGACDAVYVSSCKDGYFVEFKNIDKFVGKTSEMVKIMSEIKEQLLHAVEACGMEGMNNKFFLSYDKNPLPDKANRSIYNCESLKRLERFQIIPRAKDFGIVAEDCETMFYYLQSFGLNI